MKRFTDIQVKSLKPRDKPYFVAEPGGLYVQVHPSGRKVWRYRYQLDGRARWYRLGSYPLMTLSKAREEHRKAAARVDRGEDIAADHIEWAEREHFDSMVENAIDEDEGAREAAAELRADEYKGR